MDTERNATAAQAVARWLVAHTGLTARGEPVRHVADALGVGVEHVRRYLRGETAMTEARLTEACNRYSLAVWYHRDTGWICAAIPEADNAVADHLHSALDAIEDLREPEGHSPHSVHKRDVRIAAIDYRACYLEARQALDKAYEALTTALGVVAP